MAMPSIVLSQTGAGSSTYWTPDYFKDVFNVGLQAVVSGTVISYNIQYTLDDTTASGYAPASGNWFNVPNFSALSASAAGNFTIPCRGVRINLVTGTGSVTLNIQQAGTR